LEQAVKFASRCTGSILREEKRRVPEFQVSFRNSASIFPLDQYQQGTQRIGELMSNSAINKSTLKLVIALALTCFANVSWAQDNPPTKADLIKTLESLYPLLAAEKYEDAMDHFALPEGVKSSELAPILERRELSAAGIEVLKNNAKLDTGSALYGEDRVKQILERMGLDAGTATYGFKHQANQSTGEVLGVWKEGKFKLVRLDDVGKLAAAPPVNAAVGAAKESEPAAQPMSEAEEQSSEAKVAEVVAKLQDLEKAVKDNPNDVAAKAQYAMAMYQLKNYPAAWEQLFEASKIDPKHVGLQKGINVLISTFSEQGIFTVGVPTDTIQSIMGEPTQKVELGKDRQRWVYRHWGIDFKSDRVHEIVNLIGATEALYQPTEVVSVEFDGRGWRTGFRRKANGKVSAFLFVDGQNASNATEQISVERFLGGATFGSMEKVLEKVIADEKANRPEMKHGVIETNDKTAIFFMEYPKANGGVNDRQIVKLMLGPKDLHRLGYEIKGDEVPSEATQMKWLKIFQSATLKPTGK
jgi:tetratricopeptide (TPR) repeat protein